MTAIWTLQTATSRDLAALLPLVRAYHAFEGIVLDDAARSAALCRLLETPTFGTLWFVLHDGARAGYVAICPGYSIEFGGLDAFVDEFYLEPAHRAQGGGQAVLALVKAAARDQGIRALHLEVARDNARARRLYERLGFEARAGYVLMSTDL